MFANRAPLVRNNKDTAKRARRLVRVGPGSAAEFVGVLVTVLPYAVVPGAGATTHCRYVIGATDKGAGALVSEAIGVAVSRASV
ncbi:hypothetical protein GCM10009596_21150 [Arthrobacter rhombi]